MRIEEWRLIFIVEETVSGVLEGFVFELVLLNIFVNDL